MKKILIIDDEEDMVMMLRLRLKAAGFEVFTAHNGQEGLQRIGDIHPDIVILDLVMPVMGGWEVLKDLRSRPETKLMTVVLLTAAQSKDLQEKASQWGVVKVFMKPCDEKELVEWLNK